MNTSSNNAPGNAPNSTSNYSQSYAPSSPRAEFLAQLRAALSRLPQAEIEQSLAFYAEIIDDRIEDGMSEHDAVAQLGSVEQIAAQIIADAPFVSRTVAKAKSSKTNVTLVVILLVVLSPVWLPLIVAIFATLAALLLSLWSVVLSLWSAVLALIVSGFALMGAAVYLAFTGYPLSGLLSAGGGLVCIGLGIFGFFGMLAATKGFFKLNVFVARKIKALFVRQDRKNRQDQPFPPPPYPPYSNQPQTPQQSQQSEQSQQPQQSQRPQQSQQPQQAQQSQQSRPSQSQQAPKEAQQQPQPPQEVHHA
jgi:uncharacterized membrane protein